MDLKNYTPQKRFEKLMNDSPCLRDTQAAFEILESGSFSEPAIQSKSGWGRAKVRESICILESFGFLQVEHGKFTKIKNKFSSDVPDQNSIIDILREHLSKDIKMKQVAHYLNENYKVGDRIAGERVLKKAMMPNIEIGREKLREALIRLECAGFLQRSKQKNSLLINSLDCIL